MSDSVGEVRADGAFADRDERLPPEMCDMLWIGETDSAKVSSVTARRITPKGSGCSVNSRRYSVKCGGICELM